MDEAIESDEIRYLGEVLTLRVQRLQMQPGDIVVISTEQRISEEMAHSLIKLFSDRFPLKVIVLTDGMRIGLLNTDTTSKE